MAEELSIAPMDKQKNTNSIKNVYLCIFNPVEK